MRCIDHKKHSAIHFNFSPKFPFLVHSINRSCTLTPPWHNNASADAYSSLDVTEKKTFFKKDKHVTEDKLTGVLTMVTPEF